MPILTLIVIGIILTIPVDILILLGRANIGKNYDEIGKFIKKENK